MITIGELIARKRDGLAHAADEIDRLVRAFVAGEMPDYQMAAWLMAAYIRGLSEDETVALTDAMARSGRTIDLGRVGRPCVDKHSTGGVADTTTLVVAPLVAACGAPVAKMSGRGLGHTGGTLDKLEAIPGFRTGLAPEEFVDQVRDVGIAVMAQSDDVDPADKLMYALRDVTATVPSVPLIVSSIISKKVAGGAHAILVDVKVGSGAFMKTEEAARELARELVRVGEALGRRVECVLSDMDQPLGTAIGNALEVREAIGTLQGKGPRDLTVLSLALAARLVRMGGGAGTPEEAHERVRAALETGAALETFRRWVAAQGGDPRIAEDVETVPLSPAVRVVHSERSGFLAAVDAEGVGRAALALGAGRSRKGEPIDLGAGIALPIRVGDRVEAGEPIATLYAAADSLHPEAERRLLDALTFAEEPPAPQPLLLEP